MSKVFSEFVNFFRSVTPAQGAKPFFGQEVTPESVKPRLNQVRPIESAILDRMVSMAKLVEWETTARPLQRPDNLLTRADWIGELVWYLLTEPVVSLCFVRGPVGLIQQVLVFPDSVKPTVVRQNDTDVYVYTKNDISYTVLLEDIMQFAGRMTGMVATANVENLRAAEDEYWEKWKRYNQHEGLVAVGEGSNLPGDLEKQAALLKKLSGSMKTAALALMPKGFEVGSVAKANAVNLKDSYEVIVRHYCTFYGLPYSLISFERQSGQGGSGSSGVSQTLAYGAFMRQKLQPLLKPVFEALGVFLGVEVAVNYAPVEKASETELSETMMRFAQTGVLTINELRQIYNGERVVLDARADGDEYPNSAGAPPTEGQSSAGRQGETGNAGD